MSRFDIKRNDRLPAISVFLEAGNAAIDLTSCTVRFLMTSEATGVLKVDGAATVLSASTGKVSYEWGATDTDTSGVYRAEWEVTFPGGKTRTVPSKGYDTVEVHDDLD
jgi:hypothetical protein